ncbi:putative lysosomal Pro-X carboxypeptidase-like [Capsicum annuum]|uniref:C2H2-type domain-containing protein n=1 Tax=Capsicum annuum TaxID=4072 RepID=A0A1U8ERT8_CAPAN|nr:zinc finger protein ZAT5 [Capsicum annuum]KAF3639913.1 putative lysosomal Pro-X carboxypeptidase-like [Capsicum annuum]KAF3659780.1 putative lysosomal Pro-X carboxypeptidase-like [Capsicum annuum]PHT69226.1 hypothetical protein T459_28713 [Capsicum annuum]
MEVCQNFNDRSCAFRGKRTKRSRPSSPLDTVGTMSITTTSSGGDSDDGGGSEGGGDLCNSTYSPTTSTTQILIRGTSEEDEDMANCLILLAKSGSGQKVQAVTDELKKEKITSRKIAEITTISTTGKADFYVYECKTCNRTFPSFQALGGHRASHKKPKTIVEDKKSATATDSTAASHDDQQHHQESDDQEQGRLNKISHSLSNQTAVINNISKTKIHECSICGSEFSSGQALGGHMRRHRPPTTTATTTATATTKIISTNFETISNVSESSSSHHDEKSTRNILSLDLNLPAPPEDDHKYEQSIVFSAAPLVDCYY